MTSSLPSPVLDPAIHHFGLYRRGLDANDRPATLPVIDLASEKLDTHQRTVVILPGTRVNHEIPEKILLGKMIPDMIGYVKDSLLRSGIAKDDLPSILCVAYSHNDEQCISDHFSRTLTRRHPRAQGAATPAGTDVHEFVTQVMLPLAGVTPGHQPSVNEICQHLSQVTFYGHSFGSVFGQQAAKAFRWHLQEHGYGFAEAQRCANEIEMIALGNMAQMAEDTKGFRTHTFAAEFDPTTWATMGRIGHDHVLKLDTYASRDPLALQQEYYARCGFDPAIALAAGKSSVPRTATGALSTTEQPNGTLTLGALPDAISWRSGKRFMNQAKLDDQCQSIDDELEKLGRSTIGLNGEPIARRNNSPPHDIAMFAQPAVGNEAMVQAVDQCLLQAVNRGPRHAALGPATDALMQRTNASSSVISSL